MWIRSELKARGKAAFKANYWKCVLVALILAVLVGGGAGSSVRKNDTEELSVEQRQAIAELSQLDDSPFAEALVSIVEKSSVLPSSKVRITLGGLGLVGLALSILVFNPLIVGCYRFFLQNSRSAAGLGELGAGFRDDWGNVVLTMFLKNLFLVLWSLLLVVPGIIKAYSYRLVPYLLKEHPELKSTQAITMSRRLMNGHKWNAFVLDLSFIG